MQFIRTEVESLNQSTDRSEMCFGFEMTKYPLKEFKG